MPSFRSEFGDKFIYFRKVFFILFLSHVDVVVQAGEGKGDGTRGDTIDLAELFGDNLAFFDQLVNSIGA